MSVPHAATAPRTSKLSSFFSSRRRRNAADDAAAARSRRVLSRAAAGAVSEALEGRTLFTTIGANATFTYQDLENHVITIRTGPGVVAELVGATINGAFTNVTLGNLRPIGQGAPNDLYAIYVSQSNADSWISVIANRINPPATPTQAPFAGNSLPIAITETDGDAFVGNVPITANPNVATGIAYLGARVPAGPTLPTALPLAGSNRPITALNAPTIGVIPAGADVQAGFYVADGNDFGRFIFDGTVTGRVDVGGDIETFYAGWVLTGQAAGVVGFDVGLDDNFNVDGDLRNLVSVASIGTHAGAGNGDPTYSSGFDLQVAGRLGGIMSRDAFMGKAEVRNDLDLANDPANLGNRQTYRELEFRQPNGPGNPSPAQDLIPTIPIRNDSFDRPQILGSYLEEVPGLGEQYVVSVTGLLQDLGGNFPRDPADFYGLSLMGGQRIVVDFNAGTDDDGDGRISADEETLAGSAIIRLFDPDGRLVATDYNSGGQFGLPFGYTADRPGLYRLSVARVGNVLIGGAPAGAPLGAIDYTIDVRNPGDIAAGGIAAATDIVTITSTTLDADPAANPNNLTEAGVRVRRGDFGTALAGGVIRDFAVSSYAVDDGDLRSIEGNQVGALVNGQFDVVGVEVAQGDIGLISSASTNRNSGVGNLLGVVTTVDDLLTPLPIGGDIQVISAGGTFFGDLRVNGGIGVIRAGDMATGTDYSRLFVDFDRNGGGFIDLIDVVNTMGSLQAGGPAIDTGLGGNVRYMQVGGAVFADDFFDVGLLDYTEYGPGESTVLVDDSGSRIRLSPVANVTRGTGVSTPASLSVLAYPIRSGGSVLIDVQSTGSLEIEGIGAGVAEVGRMEIRGVGQEVITTTAVVGTNVQNVGTADRGDPEVNRIQLDTAATGSTLTALITGGITVDVLNVVVARALTQQVGNATFIRNETRNGEIVNVTAESIGDLYARGPLGLPKNQTGAAIVRYQPLLMGNDLSAPPRPVRQVLLGTGANIGDVFPFVGQTTGIVVAGGNIGTISSDMGIGNVLVHGSIGSVAPNVDNDDDNAFEGINAPVVAFNFNGSPIDLNTRGSLEVIGLAGRINNVNIGDGILPSGSGDIGRAGIYADRPIGTVRNQGLESDIRGSVVSRAAIDRISLENGAIIGSTIGVISQFEQSRLFAPAVTIPNTTGTISDVDYEIGGIDLTGRGGILSSMIFGADIGLVKIDGGFGFIASMLETVSSTRIEGVQTDGYGIRNSIINTGASGGSISARGDGSSASVLRYTPSVRYSEQALADPNFLDPFFDVAPNLTSDLYLALGLSPTTPEVAGTTDTGVIADTIIAGPGALSSVSAYAIRASGNGVPLLRDPLFNGIDPPLEREFNETMRISAGNSIGTLTTRGPINGLYVSTGRIGKFTPAGDVFNTDVTISGPVELFRINGSFAETSRLFASGPNGRIKKLQITGNLVGDITSQGKIGTMVINGLVDGTISSLVQGGRAQSINSITIGGLTPDGDLTVIGNLGKLISNNSLGTPGNLNNQVTVTGSAKSIRVNGNLQTNVSVSQNLGTLDVRGSLISSNVTVTDTLKVLKVAGDIAADSTVSARVLKKQAIKGGVAGQIIITG